MIIQALATTPPPVHTTGINWQSISLILGIMISVSTLLGIVIRFTVKGLGRYVHDEVKQVTDVLDKNISGLDQRQKMMLLGGLAVVGLGLVERIARLAERHRPNR